MIDTYGQEMRGFIKFRNICKTSLQYLLFPKQLTIETNDYVVIE
jgi:hypothetical protein